ncbi:MAG TPA: hypothetical protein VLN45_09990 [Ignavibacteriaceae bacterium]|nr:hypothetical protein [Ignavibacteriaceae bacterium]
MIKLFLFIFLFFISSIKLLSQDNKEIIQNLTQKFRDFEYQQIVNETDSLLKEKEKFSNPEIIEIYRMKGISHYALLDDSESRLSFIEILKIDTAYTLDPSYTSPKIITFFSDVKNEYLISIEGKEEQIFITKYDTVYVPVTYRDSISENNIKQALIRSVFIPGTGHLYLQSNVKSWVLTFLSAASVGSAIYFIIDSNKKEKIYLEESNINEVGERYNEYNFSYRMRNLSFITFAALWIYSQLDLLFFIEKNQPGIFSYLPKIYLKPGEGVLLNYKLEF